MKMHELKKENNKLKSKSEIIITKLSTLSTRNVNKIIKTKQSTINQRVEIKDVHEKENKVLQLKSSSIKNKYKNIRSQLFKLKSSSIKNKYKNITSQLRYYTEKGRVLKENSVTIHKQNHVDENDSYYTEKIHNLQSTILDLQNENIILNEKIDELMSDKTVKTFQGVNTMITSEKFMQHYFQ